ncbi:peroxisomal targeting signal 1 receptor isoform X2 [Zootermopsis nevadensis]|nr:peroxisomal targeting signal 1 receptor isoform X2 [Zootermopsis nevadensis]
MALRDLVEGDCGGTNSLVRLTSHFVQDRGLKEEGLRHPFQNGGGFSNTDSDQLVHQFLEETLGPPPQTFRMDSLLQEMREIESAVALHAPVPAPGVAALARDGLAPEDSIWAEQYLESGKHFDEEPHEEEIWNASAIASGEEGLSEVEEVFELGFGPKWAQEYLEASEHKLESSTEWASGSEKEADGTNKELQNTANELLKSVDDPKFTYSKFMKFMHQVGEGEVTIEGGQVIGDKEGELDEQDSINEANIWASEFATLQKSNLEKRDAAASWTEQFQGNYHSELSSTATETSASEQDDDSSTSSQFWAKLQDEWQKLAKGGELGDHPWISEFSEYYDPFKEYHFQADNPMKAIDSALEEGKQKLEAGDLPSAALCFEAAVQQNETNSEAWQLLGTTQAENEQDPAAIAALKKCLELEPSNLIALMALSVSYTNEGYQNQACHALREWLHQNPKYSDLVPKSEDITSSSKMGNVSSLLTSGIHKKVQEMYIAAARRNPSATIDSDVQCGLGVLFNLSNEYDKAVDCFKAALQVRQTDSRMWNRLGATLANGNRSEEAVDAYHNALQLSPGFIRARYNLGITCVNLAAYREAAEHLLTALNQQAAGRGVQGQRSWSAMSDSVWSTLRLVMSLLDRQDLYDALDNRDLKKLNEEFGMD